MKFIEKYDMEHTGKRHDYAIGCPHAYNYESYKESKLACVHCNCEECWNRKIPETKEEKKVEVKGEEDATPDVVLTATPWSPSLKCEMLDAERQEMVDHPQHYNTGKREVIEEMRILFGDEQVAAFCKLNAYKYLRRADYKGNKEEDLKKAEWYIDYAAKLGGEK